MRFSLVKRISAVLLCGSILLESGCFPVHSILGETDVGYEFADGTLDVTVEMNSGSQAFTGEYPTGTRAFHFENCSYEADISDFRVIASLCNTFVYYYTGIRVLGDSPDENGNLYNKKGYYENENKSGLEHFWTIASYNFKTGEYTNIITQKYDPVNDGGKMNCNNVPLERDNSKASFMVNVGYYFIKFDMISTDNGLNYTYNSESWESWKLSDKNKEKIRDSLGIKSNAFCCTDAAVKVASESKYAASFMILPDDDNFTQESVMFEVELKSEIKDGRTKRSIELRKKEDKILTVKGGNILSSNYASGNCIYVLKQSGKSLTFGIDNRDRKTSFKISLSGDKDSEDNVLQSFSVEDYSEDGVNISDEESILELVFKNRVMYYKIERNTKIFGIIEYRARLLSTYQINSFNSNYLASDEMSSIGYYSHGINLSSTEEGFKCIDTDGNVEWSYDRGAAYFSEPYQNQTLIVGFNDFSFEKTVVYYDDNGKQTSTTKTSSEFSLAQLPFATVVII